MAQICAVPGCQTKIEAGKNPGNLKFYRFPKDTNLLEKWTVALKTKNNGSLDRICNLHFTDSDYRLTNLGWKVLMPSAVPTLSLPESFNGEFSTGSGSIKVEADEGSDHSTEGLDLEKSDSCRESPENHPNVKEECDSTEDSDCSNVANDNAPIQKYHEELFLCQICDKKFASRLMLLLHQSEHYDLKYPIFTCFKCKTEFDCRFKLKDHLRKCIEKVSEPCQPFYCVQCGSTFNSRSQLLCHKTAVHHSAAYCIACDTLFYSEKSLKRHVISFHLANKYECSKCERLFATFEDCFSHKVQHALPFECPECCKSCEGVLQLDAHFKCHKSMGFYACNHCALLFSSLKSVEAHVQVQRYTKNRTSSLKCHFCNGGAPSNALHDLHYHYHQFVRGREKCTVVHQIETTIKKPHTDRSPLICSETEIKIEVADDDHSEESDLIRKSHSLKTEKNQENVTSMESGENDHQKCLESPDCSKVSGSRPEMGVLQDLHRSSRGDFTCKECGKECCSNTALAEHYKDHVKREPNDT